MIRVLVTGFGPWENMKYNPSGVVARALDGLVLSGANHGAALEGHVEALSLDVAWDAGRSSIDQSEVRGAAATLVREVTIRKPHVLLCLGVLADMPFGYDVEAAATDDRAGKDVRGLPPPSARAHATWPKVLMLPFPAKQIIQALTKESLPASWRPGVGQFLCNQIAFEAGRLARVKGSSLLRAGFIHINNPLYRAVDSYTADPSALGEAARKVFEDAEREITRAVKIAIEVCLGSLPEDTETKPAPWKYLEEWSPEPELVLAR